MEKHLHVARARRDDLTGEWRFWNGTGWGAEAGASARIAGGVSNQVSVVRRGERWTLITQTSLFGREIVVRDAAGPAGPWGPPRTVYETPAWGGQSYTYNAVAHPELSRGDDLVLSYNVNTFGAGELYVAADLYRPRFVRVPGACLAAP